MHIRHTLPLHRLKSFSKSFTKTEEEARAILEDYQNYLMTNNDGQFQQFLDYMTEQYATRDDFVF